MKLVLGTAQFGMQYGINNHNGILCDEQLKNILCEAQGNQIIHLDTALDYGNAQKRLGKIGLNGFKLISKLKDLSSYEDLEEKFNEILFQLNAKKIYALLFHSSSELVENPLIWSWFKQLKKAHPDLKIGYSVYTVGKLDHLLKSGITPEIIQIPFNIFDNEFEARFDQLEKLKVEIHVRSVFMQGLFFMDLDNLPFRVLGLKKELKQLHEICNNWNVSVGQAALQFVANKKQISGIVIGVDSIGHLNNNIKLINEPIAQPFFDELNKLFLKLDNPLKKTNEWKKVKKLR
tara:strand:- start:1702 stop:2571 length:870 start_codon:yes stop_codon:yes gene_type:complete